MRQTTTNPLWIDETGMSIPVGRITPVERVMERHAWTTLTRAKQINKHLTEFKDTIRRLSSEVYDKFMEAKGIDPATTKGNFTWFNFDRSIRIEVAISERILFDDLTIKAAQECLNEFLKEAISSKYNFVKELVTDAFATSRGKLDAKKVMGLLKYRERIGHPKFDEAAALIEQSVRRPDQKTYFRVWEKDENGEYQAVELNFSNV